jgi:3-oxoacid CoA-transferase subunit B
MIPGKMVKGMGGAMDLVQGAKKVVIIMEHVNKYGESKIKKNCTLPLTGQGVVNKLITDLAVFEFTEEGMVLVETLNGVEVKEVKDKTEASFIVSKELVTPNNV